MVLCFRSFFDSALYQRQIFSVCFFGFCVLLVFGTLIYNSYLPYSNHYHPFVNQHISIEQILQQIPTCTSNDRRRQRILLKALQAWSHLAEKHNLQYWIAYGSLIGYVQRRGLLPHDLDVDVVVMHDDMPLLVNMSQTNFSSDYEIRVQPQWKMIGGTKRSYFRNQGIHFVAPNARFIDRKTQDHVDVFPGYNFNPLYSNDTTGNQPSENITEYDVSYNWLSYPRNWTYPLQTCYFSEIKVLCPAQPEKIVATMYGADALRKSDKRCVNGRWVSSD